MSIVFYGAVMKSFVSPFLLLLFPGRMLHLPQGILNAGLYSGSSTVEEMEKSRKPP